MAFLLQSHEHKRQEFRGLLDQTLLVRGEEADPGDQGVLNEGSPCGVHSRGQDQCGRGVQFNNKGSDKKNRNIF